jgi:sugar phosphate isomerase/epimerase
MSKKIMELAKDLESTIVTTHVGVIPDVRNERYETLADACRRLGGIAKAGDGIFAIETGPETTTTLRGFLETVASCGVGVNYDPANLVMVTGDDPVRGVAVLGSHIVHTHAKDGIMIQQGDPEAIYNAFAEPGSDWIHFADYFKETPLGQGGVDFAGYLNALAEIGYKGFLTIEREVGSRPLEDIREAVRFLRSILSK